MPGRLINRLFAPLTITLLAACGDGGTSGTGGASAGTGGSGGASTTSTGGDGGANTGGASTTSSGGGGSGGGVEEPCPPGVTCVTSFPFHDERDTSKEGKNDIGVYACKPSADESGPEIVYRVTVPEDGFLSAAVYDGAGVDIDVHILSELKGDACVDRGDLQARADVKAGYVWIVADTWVDSGTPLKGAFSIDIGFLAPSKGPCEMLTGEMPRVNDGGNHLKMPATGPIVVEAHLVTQEEPAPFPSTSTEELEAHYALSQAKTGLVMHRQQEWAPLEGGDFYGAGIGDPADFPVVDEGWYVNMYWTAAARPPKGTRMILRDPNGGSRAVVVAAGYETGPGDLSNVGGTPEETHFYMGTGHEDPMKLGIAKDQGLPLGPRVCE